MPCIFSGCNRRAVHNLGVRLRRPDTSAIWAPNTNAMVCDYHASRGMRVTVHLESVDEHVIETRVQSIVPAVVQRTTPISNDPYPQPSQRLGWPTRRITVYQQQPSVPPEDVTSPQDRWTLIGVLRDGGPAQASYAVGLWEGELRIACRWNGWDGSPKGNPVSRGSPTWMVMEPNAAAAPVQALNLTDALLKLVAPNSTPS